MKTLSATFVRNHIAQTWTMAQSEPLAVDVYGSRKAVILSPEEYNRLMSHKKPKEQTGAPNLFDMIEPDRFRQIALPGFE